MPSFRHASIKDHSAKHLISGPCLATARGPYRPPRNRCLSVDTFNCRQCPYCAGRFMRTFILCNDKYSGLMTPKRQRDPRIRRCFLISGSRFPALKLTLGFIEFLIAALRIAAKSLQVRVSEDGYSVLELRLLQRNNPVSGRERSAKYQRKE